MHEIWLYVITKNIVQCSESFYSHKEFGYKLGLDVFPSGTGIGNGTHVSVGIHVKQGEFDNILKWPFQGDITVRLIDQSGQGRHKTKVIQFRDEINGARVTGPEETAVHHRLTATQFIAHNKLEPHHLQNDELHFAIINVQVY